MRPKLDPSLYNMTFKKIKSPTLTKFHKPGKVKVRPAKPVMPLTDHQKGMISGNFSLMHPIFVNKIPIKLSSLIEAFITCVVTSHNHYIKHLGIRFGTSYWKEITLYCINLCEGRDAQKVNRLATGTVDGWPTKLTVLRPLYFFIIDKENTHQEKSECFRLLLTLFKISKVCSDYSEININDIDSTFKLTPLQIDGFTAYLERQFPQTEESRRKNLLDLRVNSLVFGPANGPNSVPKTDSALVEAGLILNGPLTAAFSSYCEESSNLHLLDYIKTYATTKGEEKDKTARVAIRKDVTLRKLQSIADKGNKSRTIAICDFWTQSLLEPLEIKEQKEMVSRFARHSAFLSHTKGWQNCLKRYDETWVSLDASAWSDNFPAKLQHLYLKHRYGPILAKAWLDLTVRCKWSLGSTESTVIYGKGQGMGTKGSFILASVVDHIFIEYTMEQHYGKTLDYVKVGDDLVVSDPSSIMAEAYSSIGVSINKSKSKTKTSSGHFMEFVSRNSWNGYDISAISSSLLVKAKKQPFYLVVLIRHLAERGCVDINLINTLVKISCDGVIKEEVRVLKLLSLFETLSGTPFIKGNPLVCTLDPTNMKFILIELVRLLNLKYLEWEKKETRGNAKLLQTYGEDYYDVQLSYPNDRILFYTGNKSSLKRIKMISYLIASNSDNDPILETFCDGCLVLSDTGLNEEELTLCQNLLKQTLVVESWLNDLKIINRLDLLSPDNSKAMLYLMKGLNKLINKVEDEQYFADPIPNSLITTRRLTSTLNKALGHGEEETTSQSKEFPEDS
jgi:hypothetical protein